jgi:hypothetical protein
MKYVPLSKQNVLLRKPRTQVRLVKLASMEMLLRFQARNF